MIRMRPRQDPPSGTGRTGIMQSIPNIQPSTVEQAMRRGRQLRSAAAIAMLAAIGSGLLHIVERAFVRPYRMAGTPGCGCEA